MGEKYNIKDKTLASSLGTLALLCAQENTDNCDIELTTEKGVLNCHIEFSVKVNKDESDN